MFRNGASRTIPVVLIIIVMIIAIGALITAGRSLFSDTGETSEQVDVGREALLDTDPNHSVQMIVRGQIVGDEDHHSYQVTISPSGRNLTTFTGYLDSTIKNHQLPNNTKAYEQFVYALDKANMMKGDELTGEDNDTRGICANGRIYRFSVLEDGTAVKSLWTSTCRGSRGSLNASSQQLTDLFLDQIPDNKKLLADLKL